MPGAVARIHVELDPDGELVRLARLVATGVATSVGMGIDEVEDCRAAVDEMCSSLIERAAPRAILQLDIAATEVAGVGPSIEVRGRVAADPSSESDEVRGEISRMILDAVTDSHDLRLDAASGEITFTFVRSSRGPAPRGGPPHQGGGR